MPLKWFWASLKTDPQIVLLSNALAYLSMVDASHDVDLEKVEPHVTSSGGFGLP